MKLLSVFLLVFVAASLLLLDAENASAAPIAIRQSVSKAIAPQVLSVRSGRNASSSSKKKGKGRAPPAPAPPVPSPAKVRPDEDHHPRPTNTGASTRPGAPEALLVDKNSRWAEVDKKMMNFLHPAGKADGGKVFIDKIGKAGAGSGGTLYSEDNKGVPATKNERQDKGYRIDNQGNPGTNQIFNVQAQTNGGDPTTFAACVGWKDCGADADDIIGGLKASAQNHAPVHLVPPEE